MKGFDLNRNQAAGDEAAVWEFHRRLAGAEEAPGGLMYCVQPAVEGIQVDTVYRQGILSAASASAGGAERSDVIVPLRTILTVPLKIEREDVYGVAPRVLKAGGTVYVEKLALETLNAQRGRRGSPAFQDPRSAVEEVLLSGDAKTGARTALNIFFERFTDGDAADGTPRSFYDGLLQLQGWGFRINRPHIRLCRSVEEVLETCAEIESMRDDFPYRLRGALIQPNWMIPREQASGGHGGAPPEGLVYGFEKPR